MDHQGLSSNLNSQKTRFALRFLRALARIKMNTPTSTNGTIRRGRCSRRIKLVADASMASVVGSRRSWSRAVLLNIRSRRRRCALVRRKVVGLKKKKKRDLDAGDKPGQELSRANELRRLVPGGDAMDFCSLLEETAHYIKCLNTQVQVMQNIADYYSS